MNIDKYFEEEALRDPSSGDYGPVFEKLIDRRNVDGRPLDTTEATKIWVSIANGKTDVGQALLWVQLIAKRIVNTVVVHSERDAGPAALKAIGFYGRSDPHRDAKRYMSDISTFDYDDEGNSSSMRRITGKQWVGNLRKQGYLSDVKDKTAVNLVDIWRKELGI